MTQYHEGQLVEAKRDGEWRLAEVIFCGTCYAEIEFSDRTRVTYTTDHIRPDSNPYIFVGGRAVKRTET